MWTFKSAKGSSYLQEITATASSTPHASATPAALKKERGQGFPNPWAACSLWLRKGMPGHAEKLDIAAEEPGVGGKQSCQGREVLWVVSL